jgi:hypothetical protein
VGLVGLSSFTQIGLVNATVRNSQNSPAKEYSLLTERVYDLRCNKCNASYSHLTLCPFVVNFNNDFSGLH